MTDLQLGYLEEMISELKTAKNSIENSITNYVQTCTLIYGMSSINDSLEYYDEALSEAIKILEKEDEKRSKADQHGLNSDYRNGVGI